MAAACQSTQTQVSAFGGARPAGMTPVEQAAAARLDEPVADPGSAGDAIADLPGANAAIQRQVGYHNRS